MTRETIQNMYNTYFDKIPNNPTDTRTATDIIFFYLQYRKFHCPECYLIYKENLHDYLHFFTELTNIPERFKYPS